jgi:hypothetical protein
MDHWEFKEAVHNYRMKSGHAINYYDGGAENSPVNHPGTPFTGKREQKGSLAKDKMRDLLSKGDSKSNRNGKRKNDLGLVNDPQ